MQNTEELSLCRLRFLWAALSAILFLSFGGGVEAQQTPSYDTQDIINMPDSKRNGKDCRFAGEVLRWTKMPGSTRPAFVIKDSYENEVVIMCMESGVAPPKKGEEINGEGYVTAMGKKWHICYSGPSLSKKSSTLLLWLIGAAGLILMAVAIMVLRSPGSSSTTAAPTPATATPAPVSHPAPVPPPAPREARPAAPAPTGRPDASLSATRKIEGKRVAFFAPVAESTLRVLPGRFIIKGGDGNIDEIRLYQTGTTAEWTFGRAEGEPLKHIQIKDQTVSGMQAVIKFENGEYSIMNCGWTNPTMVNGKELQSNETVVLKDGAEIVFGAVVVKYEDTRS